jgi:Uma2 family endonuclease
MLTVVRPDIDAIVATGVTANDLAALSADGYRYDLVEGNLIRVSPAGFGHGRLAAEVVFRLGAFVAEHAQVWVVVGPETGFRLARDPDTVLGPDAAVVRRDRLPPAEHQTGYLELAPDLAVEIVSPTDRWTTLSDKVEAYLSAGVRLGWVFEPNRRAVRVYTPQGERRLRADRGDALDGGDVLPGLQLALADLFAALD